MIDIHFLLDNNVVSHLSAQHLSSRFFGEHCHIPTEVLHEAGNRAALKVAEYRTSPSVLEALREVMSKVDPTDLTLVNLYANKGNGDPVIVACGLVETREAELLLVPPTWQVVSEDKAVRRIAKEVGVVAVSREEFLNATAGLWED